MDAARKVGIEGAEELLLDPSKGVDEVCFPLTVAPGGHRYFGKRLQLLNPFSGGTRLRKNSTNTLLAFLESLTLWYEY